MSRKIFTLCLTLLAVSAVSQEPAEAETVNSAIGATEELGAEALEAEASTIELANVETAVAQTVGCSQFKDSGKRRWNIFLNSPAADWSEAVSML